MQCPHLDKCRVFSYIEESGIREDVMALYCRGPMREKCERYQLHAAGKPIPLDLLPDGTALAV